MPYNAAFNLAAQLADLRAMREAEQADEQADEQTALLITDGLAPQAPVAEDYQVQSPTRTRPRQLLKRLFH